MSAAVPVTDLLAAVRGALARDDTSLDELQALDTQLTEALASTSKKNSSSQESSIRSDLTRCHAQIKRRLEELTRTQLLGGGVIAEDDPDTARSEARAARQAQQMRRDLEQMKELGRTGIETIDRADEKLRGVELRYGDFGRALQKATGALLKLKAQSANDQKYIWWSFYIFLGTCLYIILRRLWVFWWIGMWFYYIIEPALSSVWSGAEWVLGAAAGPEL